MKLKVIISLFAVLLMISCNQSAQKETINLNTASEKQASEKLHIYYFYGAHRCPTCNAVETNLKQLVQEQFKNEIQNKSLQISYLNWEESENKELVEKFQIYTSTLILTYDDKGTSKNVDLTEFAFTYARKQPDFYKQSLSDTIHKYLNL